jgi:hypothetical protein
MLEAVAVELMKVQAVQAAQAAVAMVKARLQTATLVQQIEAVVVALAEVVAQHQQ